MQQSALPHSRGQPKNRIVYSQVRPWRRLLYLLCAQLCFSDTVVELKQKVRPQHRCGTTIQIEVQDN